MADLNQRPVKIEDDGVQPQVAGDWYDFIRRTDGALDGVEQAVTDDRLMVKSVVPDVLKAHRSRRIMEAVRASLAGSGQARDQ